MPHKHIRFSEIKSNIKYNLQHKYRFAGFILHKLSHRFCLQMLMVQSVVADINRRTGESECQFYKDRLLYTEDGQRNDLIDQSRTLSCHGELKNNRGLVSRFLNIFIPTTKLQ